MQTIPSFDQTITALAHHIALSALTLAGEDPASADALANDIRNAVEMGVESMVQLAQASLESLDDD